MAAHVSVVKSGVVLAIVGIVALAAAGCSTNTSNTSGTGTSSTTAAHSSPAAPLVSGAPSPSGTASARFVGHWQRHASTLDITATTATLFAGLDMGPCSQGQAACSEIDTLGVVSGDDTQLTLAVTAVNYGLKDGQTTSVNPSPGPSTAVGDSIQLVSQAPGLLEQTVLEGFPGWRGGGLYWCGAGLSPGGDQGRCGA